MRLYRYLPESDSWEPITSFDDPFIVEQYLERKRNFAESDVKVNN